MGWVVCTNDASLVFYGGSNGLYVYNVAKNTTTKPVLPTGFTIYDIAASKTGQYVVAASMSNIYVSSDFGVTFAQTK